MYKVLLVDDEPHVIQGLRTIVDWKKHGFRICGEASDGEEAFQMLQASNPDLVVTDIRMPAMDGLQLIRKAYEDLDAKAKFVIISGHSEFSYAQAAMRYKVSDYLLKPLDDEELDAVIQKMSRKIREEQSERERIDRQLGSIANRSIHRLLEGELEVMKHIAGAEGEDGDFLGKLAEFSQAKEHEHVPPRELKSDFSALSSYWAMYAESKEKNDPKDIVGEMKEYIRQNYRKDIKLQGMAGRFYMNPVYLGQLFKKSTGMQFNEYLHLQRVEEAKKLLLKTNLKISEIARTVGYHDVEYFVGKFKSITKVIPSAYKNKLET